MSTSKEATASIDPDQAKAFLTEPDAPSPSDCRRQPAVHQTRAGSSASTITVGDISEPLAVDRNGLTFNTAWAVYTHQHKRYKDQETGIEKLRVWVMDTVSQHTVESAREPVETIAQWYSNLKEQCGQTEQATKSRAREEYRAAIKPPTKPAKVLLDPMLRSVRTSRATWYPSVYCARKDGGGTTDSAK
ncbi:hypothetical protein V1509DRAFT_637035 [Lipomyces kononenkoae]